MTDILKGVSLEEMEKAIAKALEGITGETLSVNIEQIEYLGTNMFKKHANIQMSIHHRVVQSEGGDIQF